MLEPLHWWKGQSTMDHGRLLILSLKCMFRTTPPMEMKQSSKPRGSWSLSMMQSYRIRRCSSNKHKSDHQQIIYGTLMIIIFLCAIWAIHCQLSITELNIETDLIAQHGIVEHTTEGSTITCEHMIVDNLSTRKIEIDQIIRTHSIKLQYISPDPRLTTPQPPPDEIQEEPELIQKSDPSTIRFHGNVNFKKGVIHSDGLLLSTSKVQLEAEFLQVDQQSQWIPIEDDIRQKIMEEVQFPDKDDPIAIRDAKQYIKHNIHMLTTQEKIQPEELPIIKDWEQKQQEIIDEMFPTMMKARQSQIVTLKFDNIPVDVSRVMIKAHFYLLSELHGSNMFAWAKIDNKHVWVQPIKQIVKCNNFKKELQPQFHDVWNFPITLSNRHITQGIIIEFGVQIKNDDLTACSEKDQQILGHLQKVTYLFGIDDFQLFYR